MTETESQSQFQLFSGRHRWWGWWQLFVFVSAGLVLESFHGLKIGMYLDPGNEIRREMWRLAHAHGTLTGVVHLLFAASFATAHWKSVARARVASTLLVVGSVFLPLGFVLGGIAPTESDPWIGVWLVPAGAIFLVLAVLLTAIEGTRT